MPDYGGAGRSAQLKYDTLLRSWRRRNVKLFVILGFVCGSIMVASFAAGRAWPTHAWTLGLLAGAAMAFFMMAWLTPPGWIENWQSGVWGEEATAKRLRPLERQGWIVIHDLRAGRGNVDHIAIGPGGVFLLDSKRLAGSVRVTDGEMTVNRLDDPDLTYLHTGSVHLRRLAAETSSRLTQASRIKQWVNPVMVLWTDFPQGVVESECAYVHGDRLAAWLLGQPQRIAPTNVGRIADAVRSAWTLER